MADKTTPSELADWLDRNKYHVVAKELRRLEGTVFDLQDKVNSAVVLVSERNERIAELEAELDSWRRVAEKLEGEKQPAWARIAES